MFLQSRGIPEENIQKMQQDHIDSSVIGEIDDATMTAYIPAYGDRIATRRFCMEKQRKGGDDLKRLSLFEKLRRKMGTLTSNKDTDQDFEEEHSMQPTKIHLRNNKRAVKMTRKIELGWIHDKKQVRKRNGGGTRVLDISKKATKTEILSQAKKLFFPNEKSRKGKWEEFSHNIVDFQEAYLDEDVSVGELYETHKLGILRFYVVQSNLTNGDEVFPEMTEGTDEQTDAARLNERQKNATEDNEQVIFGPLQGGPFSEDLDDTILHEPIEEAQITFNAYSSTPVHSDTVPAGPLSPTYELFHVTVKLHRVSLLEELIPNFKDEAMMSYSVKYSFIHEMGADADGVSRDVYAAFCTEFLDCAAEGADISMRKCKVYMKHVTRCDVVLLWDSKIDKAKDESESV
ncbi:uncharacterized protein LOC122142538 [Cyprinus carpio]|uniref:Uncharacterized protein LOC122142538 n=1 Tax=Cyprinus carpio TaxID=7962 RepID=A0A9Q9XX97_CYPCA|nr:uncharacterized protein LOC122142538 [Cyprinus carpio]